MISILLSLSLVMAPVIDTIPFTDTLELKVPLLKRRERAPSEGYLLSIGDLAQVRTELKTNDSNCKLRIDALIGQYDLELSRIQSEAKERIKSFEIRIDDLGSRVNTLGQENLVLDKQLSDIKLEYGTYRFISYTVGAALIGISTYAFLR